MYRPATGCCAVVMGQFASMIDAVAGCAYGYDLSGALLYGLEAPLQWGFRVPL